MVTTGSERFNSRVFIRSSSPEGLAQANGPKLGALKEFIPIIKMVALSQV